MAYERASAAPLVQLPNSSVRLTADHAVRAADGSWRRAGDCDGARLAAAYEADGDLVYDLITSRHRLVVAGSGGKGELLCADYEETEDTAEDLDRFVRILGAEERDAPSPRVALAAAA